MGRSEHVRHPAGLGGQPLATFTRIAADLSMAFRRMGATFFRRRELASLLLALAVLLALPMVAASHDDRCPEGQACPTFGYTTRTIDIHEDAELDEVIATLLPATDDQKGIPIHELWDPEDEIVQGNSEQSEYGDEVTQAFYHLEEYDLDENDQLTVTLIRLKTKTAYDFETKKRYEFMLVACDNDYYRDHVHVTVNIVDVKEPPLAPTVDSVEGASTQKLVVRWTAPDNEGRPPITGYDLRYRECQENLNGQCQDIGWTDGRQNVADTTTIVSGTGLKAGTKYQVQVQATNAEGDSPWSEPKEGSTLTDGQDHLPVFLEDDQTTRTLSENIGGTVQPVRNIGSPVTATNDDGDSQLTYSLEDEAASFDIDASSGQLKTRSGRIYNYETGTSYTVTVKVEEPLDDGMDTNTNTITVIINIADEDEPPLAPDRPVVSTASDTELSVVWTAPDNMYRPGINGYDLRYRASGQNWVEPDDAQGLPRRNRDSRTIAIMGLDSGTEYQVQVRAVNDEGEGPWSEFGMGSTNEEGNTTPSFNQPMPAPTFNENFGGQVTMRRMSIGDRVTATDDEGHELTFALEGQYASLFTIREDSGQISTESGVNYDHEAKSSYSVTVKVTDSEGASVTDEVTISVEDVDERPDAPAAPTVSSQSTTELLVIWSPPADNEGRPLIHHYNLQWCQEGGECSIDPQGMDWNNVQQNIQATNHIITGLTADPTYLVRVRATNDEGDSNWSLSGSGQTLNQGNAGPKFDSDMTTRSFLENTSGGRNIGPPVTVRDDNGSQLTITLEGRDVDSFDIVPSGQETLNGTSLDIQIKTRGIKYDYETSNHPYFVIVKAEDNNGASDAIAVAIDLIDVDEGGGGNGGGNGGGSGDGGDGGSSVGRSQPAFTGSSATRSFDENSPPGQNVGAPIAAKVAVGSLTYTLAGADVASFDIVPKTGQLKTKAGVTYDYETRDTYAVTVKATGSSGVSATIAVTINVLDVDEKPAMPDAPVVNAPDGSSTSLVVTWTAPDTNGGPPLTDYDVEYREGISGDWSDWHHDSVATTTTITGLRPHTDYQVRVLAKNDEAASDWSPPGSGQTNNTVPVFANADATRSFPENTPSGENIGTPVVAGDADGDPLSYTLSGPDAASFDIESETGQLKTKAGVTYDHEVKVSYAVAVSATDPLDASETLAVTIHVTDVAEKPATPDAPTVSAPDGTNTSLLVTWTAPDLNGGPLLTDYDLEYRQGAGGDWSTWPHDGIDTSAMMTDLGPHTDYQVRVQAFNGELHSDWSLPGSGQTNNTAPSFASAAATRSFPENTSSGQGVGAPVAATDADGDELTYTLGGVDAASFDIDSETGQIKTRSGVSYDYEVKASYAVTVQATDPLGASGSIAVTIDVTDVAEKPATPDAPTVSAPDGTNTSLLVTWTAPELNGGPLLTDYDLEYRQGAGGDWSTWPHDGIDTSAMMTGLRPHTDYQVRVQAFNGELHSDWSLPGSGQTNNTAPSFASAAATRSFPENTSSGQGVGAPVAATDADGDELTYTLGGADAASFDIDSETGQLKTISGVSYDYEVQASYAVTVQATDPLGASGSIAVTIDVTDVAEPPAMPDAPTVSAPDGTNTSLLVTWTAPDLNGGPLLTDYDVQYRQGTAGDWDDWQHDGTATTATITGLDEGAGYQVRVRALNDEATSDWSPPGSGRTNATMDRWLGRFGRSIAQQMMDGVEERLASPCRTGLQGTLAGYGFGGDRHLTLHGTGDRLARRDGSGGTPPYWAGGDLEVEGGSVTGRTLLAGTEFELGSETAGSGIACVWGRGGHSSFHGREGSFSLDGNVTTGTLGADYAKGPWTVGLALSHSRGEGRSSRDDIEAALTGLYPYAGYKITERFSVWGLGGFGRGGLTVTPDSGTSMETDMSLLMIAAGARSLLLTAAHGMNVAFETDGFWVHAASDAAPGLLASKADANRLRFGLESSYRVVLKDGGALTPKFEIGWRYDGGGAETGLGVDVGGGILWSTPVPGISAEIVIRRVLMHEATGFNDWSVSGLVRYDPNPSSERGLSASLTSSIGQPSLDGTNALLERETMAGLASFNTSHGGQLTAEAAYGFPILGGRFTGAPWVGAGLLKSGSDYRVGYRISPAGQFGSHMQVGIEGMRRDNTYDDVVTEHAIHLRLALGW